VLDHHDRATGIDQAMQDTYELLDVRHVQPHRRLVEHIQGAGRWLRLLVATSCAPARHRRRAREFRHQFDALRLAAGERRALLAERQVTEADILQQLQCMVDARVRREELHGLVHAHREHVADAAAAVLHGQGLGVKPSAAAGVAGEFHVGQETHLHSAQALALAARAAAARRVE